MVCAQLFLVCPKDYVSAIRTTYVVYIVWYYCPWIFYHVLCVLCDHVTITVTMLYDVTDVWQCDHDVTLTLILDPRRNKTEKNKKKKKIK